MSFLTTTATCRRRAVVVAVEETQPADEAKKAQSTIGANKAAISEGEGGDKEITLVGEALSFHKPGRPDPVG